MSDHMMSIVSLTAGLPGLIETCIHGGEFFVSRLDTYRQADQRIAEFLQMFSLHWDFQRDALKKLASLEPRLDEDVKQRFIQVLESLRRLLEKASSTISKYTIPTSVAAGPSAVQKLRYALLEEKVLATLEKEITAWENRFLMRLTVLVDMGSVDSTTTLASGSKNAKVNMRVPLLRLKDGSSVEVLQSPGELRSFEKENTTSGIYQTSDPTVLVELYEAQYSDDPKQRVEDLAGSLCAAEPDLMHIMPCMGYMKSGFGVSKPGLLFRYPVSTQGMKPRSLRSLLLEPSIKHPLEDRVRMALELATAVWYIHSGGFVHKCIRPETILVFVEEADSSLPPDSSYSKYPWKLGPSFLAGFTRFRSDDRAFESGRNEDSEVSRYCYRHPRRWGIVAQEKFSMLHDIYSLGVILLEIGLWNSLLEWKNSQDKLPLGLAALLRGYTLEQVTTDPSLVRTRLIDTAKRQLPRVMGSKYTAVVVSCLSCVEGGLTTSSKGLADRNPALAYMEAVVERLEEIEL
ncbi:hypothetical protein ONS95_011859 [Cadophora gregata]|uniref:uncharacterized protein n=1 Tax=Cadophora gregata TaxID=51156 RepID=UPI0026DC94D5|nr:uncharacterized protein ONS95_011859 [Cadophora gregata]KAK0117519.1 hypothetical protein ONS95_011859 [Cadophora gregata]